MLTDVTANLDFIEVKDDLVIRRAADEWKNVCGRRLQNRYGEVQLDNLDRKLDFHSKEHSLGVAERVGKIVEVLRGAGVDVTERDEILLGMKAMAHDLVQDWEEGVKEGGVVVRVRSRDNEKYSAEELGVFMKSFNKKNPGMFTDEEIASAHDIDCTSAGWDPRHGTAWQPGLIEELPLQAKILAIADLLEPGFDPEAYMKNGMALFREDNVDITRFVRDGDLGTLSPEFREKWEKRMRTWIKGQETYAKGRYTRFKEKEAGLFGEQAGKALIEATSSGFEKSIEMAAERSNRVDDMDFEGLLREVGYK